MDFRRSLEKAHMSALNESAVEDAALAWFRELGYAVGHGPLFAPGEPAAERHSFGDVVLVGRLRDAIRRLNPAIPEEEARTSGGRTSWSSSTGCRWA